LRELLESFLQGSRYAGSFDCVVVRVADDNFAQDDKQKKTLRMTFGRK
jgi:hypothetical protein